MRPLVIYDWRTRTRLAYLQNAYDISYTQNVTSTWTAAFKLSYYDEKKVYCNPFNLVEIWDIDSGGDDVYVGLFRIMSIVEEFTSESSVVNYTLEHVMTTLLDDSVLGYIELGSSSQKTPDVIKKLLTYQLKKRWVLKTCSFSRKYEYAFEDSNLLGSIRHVIQPLPDKYYWSFNTQTYPWELNLLKPSTIPVADIRYGKNIFGIKKTTDPRSLFTRLYIYGKEDAYGVKLNIKSVNDNKAYLDSATGRATYGLITAIVTDDRFENVKSLYDYGVALLTKLAHPLVTYSVDIQKIYNAANLKLGDTVRMVTDDGLDQNLVVQEIRKDDLTGAPHSGTIVIGEGTANIGLIIKGFI